MINKESIVKFWKVTAFISTLFPLFFFIRAGNFDQDHWFFTLFDDAMISMTYARTLSETGELVWFPGAERVQGFTNLFWTLYMASLHHLGLVGTQVSAAISLTGILCIIGSSFICFSLVNKTIPEVENKLLWSFSVASIIPLLYPLVFWSLRGMEVGVLCFLALSTMVLSLKYENDYTPVKSKFIFTATLLTSATGVLIRLDFAAIVFVIAIVQFLLSANKKNILQFTIAHLGFIVLTFLVILVFQLFYYQDIFPNTYRLKVGGYGLIDRLLNGVLTIRNVATLTFLVIVIGLIALKNRYTKTNKIILITSSVFLTACAYSIWVGGDAWEWSRMANRYVSITLPFAIVSIMLGAYQFFCQKFLITKQSKVKIFFGLLWVIYLTVFYPRPKSEDQLLASLALITITAFFCIHLSRDQNKRVHWFHNQLFTVCLLLTLVSGWSGLNWIFKGGLHIEDDFEISKRSSYYDEITKGKAVIAVVWAGAPAYYSKRNMIDLLGKNDRKIASIKPVGKIYPGHNKWDYNYSIGSLRPDVVMELFVHTDLDKKKLEDWGYIEKCYLNKKIGYFLRHSEEIHWSLLTECVS